MNPLSQEVMPHGAESSTGPSERRAEQTLITPAPRAADFMLTEDRACGLIMDLERIRRALCLPRYTPFGWWECDVFELTASGYFREYEVKLTLADFRNDAKKQRDKRPYVFNRGAVTEVEKKHDLLAMGDARGPAEFSYVAPAGLISVQELPRWAGLLEIHQTEPWSPTQKPGWRLKEVIAAPRLHREKANPKIREHMMSVCYYRFHDALRALRNREPLAAGPDETAPDLQATGELA